MKMLISFAYFFNTLYHTYHTEDQSIPISMLFRIFIAKKNSMNNKQYEKGNNNNGTIKTPLLAIQT